MIASSHRRVLAALCFAAAAAFPFMGQAQGIEGVKVRGHWIVEVREPDGRLVERREFDNNLVAGGPQLLAQYLTGSSPTRWVVELGVYGGATPICNGGTFNGFTQNNCFVVDPASTQLPTGTSVFPTLKAERAGATLTEIRITGNATALVNGQIVYVATRQGSCGPSIAPASCNPAGTVLQFTVHDITPTPISVAAGQIVQFEVRLSFS